MKPCLLFLTCANLAEAERIEKTLLKKRLVVCSKRSPVSSSFLFNGKTDQSKEVLLIMDSIKENFAKIEAEVRALHSYKTFVLIAVPVSQTTGAVENWISEGLRKPS